MDRIRRLIAALWLACLAGLGAGAPEASLPPEAYGFRSYGVDQGLTNLSVLSLAQDSEGYLWVGTEEGVFQYDGRRFRKSSVAEGLPSPSVHRVRAGQDGWLWLETERGLALGRRGSFKRVDVGSGFRPNSQNQALATDRQGGVWLGSADGLWYARGLSPFQKVGGLPSGPVTSLWCDGEGHRVLAARTGELLIREGEAPWEVRALPEAFRKDSPQGLLVDRLGRIWIRSQAWLLRYPASGGEPEVLTSRLPEGLVQWADVVEDAEGRIWAPTARGAACFEGEGTWLLGEEQGLTAPTVNTLLVDREGSLWIGSEGLHRQLGRLLWSFHTRRQGLPHETVWSLFHARDGTFWAGTQFGLARSRREGWTALPGAGRRTIYALAQSPDGTLWAGGLRPRTSTQNTLIRIRPGQDSGQELPLPTIRSSVAALAAAPDGSLWVGTVNDGLHRAWMEGGSLRSERVALPREIPGENIHRVLVDAKGQPLVSASVGLAWRDGEGWHRMAKAQGLLDDQTGPIALAPDGSLWVAYWDAPGLTHLRRRGGGWELDAEVRVPPELIRDSVYSMDVDPRGGLWIGTSVGIRNWDGRHLRLFTRHDGLPGDDTSGNAVWVDPSGDVWFGMTAGAAHYSARRPHREDHPPSTWITGFRDGAGRGLDLGEEPILAFKDRAVSFEFSPATYLHEAVTRTQVRLVGFEDAWRDADVFQARYTGLPPGRFRFEVRAKEPNGEVGPARTQSFQVLSPWWLSWWFLGLCGLGLLGLVALAVKWRTRLILRRMVELEALVHERTWNLELANDALSKANSALEEASMVDPLTGLKNRRFLGLSLPEEIARVVRAYHQGGVPMHGQDLAFLLVDLDHFKAVNDSFGHAAGDAVLRQSAAILRAACRETDTVVRWGGEEFLVVAKATARDSAEVIARKIVEGFEQHLFDLGGGLTLRKTCSIGFSAFPILAGDPLAFRWEDSVEVADLCLYAAKSSGRDAYVGVWVPDEVRAERLQGRLIRDLPALVTEGIVHIRTSLPEDRPLRWKG